CPSRGAVSSTKDSHPQPGGRTMAHSMNVGAAGPRPAADVEIRATSPAYQAYQILHWGFTAAPILFGLDKFFNLMTQWHQYLAPTIANLIPLQPRMFMQVTGAVE